MSGWCWFTSPLLSIRQDHQVRHSATCMRCGRLKSQLDCHKHNHKETIIMKVLSSTTAPLVLLSVLMAATHPLLARAHQEETSAIAAGASNLRDVTSNQEDRALAKGGNGGGGGGGKDGGKQDKDPTPQPTPQPTPPPAPSPTPPPVFRYPTVPTDSCGTRAPSSAAPFLSLAPTQCVNPSVCSGNNPCCDGYSCKGKRCRSNARQLRLRERKVAIEGAATDERQLNECTENASQCNVYGNELLCGDTLPSSRPVSEICNYGGGAYPAIVKACDSDKEFCCEDGNGGYYFGLTCWGVWQGEQCCPKGYTRLSTGCAPLNCCDGDATHRINYCPNSCPGN